MSNKWPQNHALHLYNSYYVNGFWTIRIITSHLSLKKEEKTACKTQLHGCHSLRKNICSISTRNIRFYLLVNGIFFHFSSGEIINEQTSWKWMPVIRFNHLKWIVSHSIMTLFWQNDNLIYVIMIHIYIDTHIIWIHLCDLRWHTRDYE